VKAFTIAELDARFSLTSEGVSLVMQIFATSLDLRRCFHVCSPA
jgi:hypothetical protein